MMTREEELKLLAEYLETTGATKLPKDTRGAGDLLFSVWKRPPPRKRGRKPKAKPAAAALKGDQSAKTK